MKRSYLCSCTTLSSFSYRPVFPSKDLLESDVWLAELSLLAAYQSYLSLLLSPEEISRAAKLPAGQHRNRYILSRGILRLVLAYYIGSDPSKILLHTAAAGKPYTSTGKIAFNLSHTANRVVIALNRADEIGIDIESMASQDQSLVQVAASYFTAADRARLDLADAAEFPKLFYTYWTRKEAFLKALGTGFTSEMDQVQVSGLTNQFTFNPGQEVLTDTSCWHILTFYPEEGYTASIAYSPLIRKIQFYDAVQLLK